MASSHPVARGNGASSSSSSSSSAHPGILREDSPGMQRWRRVEPERRVPLFVGKRRSPVPARPLFRSEPKFWNSRWFRCCTNEVRITVLSRYDRASTCWFVDVTVRCEKWLALVVAAFLLFRALAVHLPDTVVACFSFRLHGATL